jgi:hypothetical protein
MGLFTRRRALATWQPDGTGVVSNGDQGGDIQRGDSYSVRFTHPDLPGSLITVSFYAAEYDENPFEFVVQRQVEWMVCEDPSDPGGTEIWSDYSYDDVSELVCYSAADAEQDAREWAEDALGEAWKYGGWDGQPSYGEAG